MLVSFLSSFGQTTPYFQNFNLSKYNAANQNWDVSVAKNGKVYVANGKGLLEYDGLDWKFFELPNKTTIRSVLAHKGKIYTGSFEEIGYWQKDTKGQLFYTSLNDFIKEGISTDEEFWQIIPYKEGIAFRSFSNLYIYENGSNSVVKLKPTSTIITINEVNDRILVSTLKEGIYEYLDGQLRPFISSSEIFNKKIIGIIEVDEELHLFTALNGIYKYANGRLTKIENEINQLIKQHQLNAFVKLTNENMAFGTIKNGIYLTNAKGQVLYHLSKEEGLNNNTVLGLWIDRNNLWVSLDNGIALIDLKGNYTFFNDTSGKLGAVYDVIKFKDNFYIGTNTGLFYLNNDRQLNFVENSQGQVWDLKEIDGQLLCGHNDGTFLVEENGIKRISPYTGGWTIKKVPEASNTYIQGTYAGLVKFTETNRDWNIKHLGKTTMPLKYLVFEDENTAWTAHAYKGLYKIKLDKSLDTVSEVVSYEDKGLWSSYNVRVYKLKNDICFKTNDGWQKYEPLLDSIVPFDLLNKSLGKDSYIISDFESDMLAIKNKNDAINFISLSDNKSNLSLTNKYFEDRLVVGSEKVTKINDSIYCLNLNNGFMLINSKSSFDEEELFTPVIESINLNNALIDLNELNSSENLDLKYGQSIIIEASSAKSGNYKLEYAFLNQDASKWFPLQGNTLELNSLSSGEQTLAIRAKSDSGTTSDILKVNISVSPPWYIDTPGLLLYAITFILFISIMYLLHKRKIDKEQALLHEKFEKEQEELLRKKTIENDKKIIQLKNESLRNELKLKSKQLANSAMALVKKNEALQELKQELISHKEEFNNYYSYKKLIKKVNGSIEHEDEWEVFEHNFNQVHEEFFAKLKKKHAALTHKDLKICAYIKMNLATKEIAPLMNISVRGVETHRYRLKKKLDLENDNSLSDYLLNFN